MNLSLYIHIPFCASKCDYCDFFSVPVNRKKNSDLPKALLDAELTELRQKLDRLPDAIIETIFIGGGTPSSIEPGLFYSFLSGLADVIKDRAKKNAEFTTEANPESCSSDFLSSAAAGGINRLSLGIQSFNPVILDRIGRACYPDNIFETAADIRSKWNGKLSLDIISGISDGFLEDINLALSIKPDHLSVYQLTVEENTVLFDLVGSGRREMPDSKLQSDAITEITGVLARAGFNRYEISNYAPDNNRCLHNLRYWDMQSYAGIGPSAVSSIYGEDEKTRTENTKNIHEYINAVNSGSENFSTIEYLQPFDFFIEHYIMGSRLCGGINESIFIERFGKKSSEFIPVTIGRWKKRGMITNSILNEKGLLFLDAYLSDVYSELSGKINEIKSEITLK